MKKFALLLALSITLFFHLVSYSQSNADLPDKKAQEIVDKAIEKHGGKKFEQLNMQFDFRDRTYKVVRKKGMFSYRRLFKDSTGSPIVDILTNVGFERLQNNQPVSLPEERQKAFTNAINSVVYFALLPYGLNDKAVIKKYLGEVTIKGQSYYKIKVTFQKEGGGKDFDDEFIYWFHRDKKTLNYLAYLFHVDGGGLRFRAAYNPRKVGGILLLDYENYAPNPKEVSLETLDKLYENGELKLLSKIENKDVSSK